MTYIATKAHNLKPKIQFWWFYGAAILLTLCSIALSPLALRIEQSTSLPALFQWRGPVEPPLDIVIVALNSAAAERMGLSRHSHTWPRTLYSNLLLKLQEGEVELVVMDIVFKEAKDPEQDSALEQAISQSGNVILFKYLKRHQISSGFGSVDIEEEIAPLPQFSRNALATGVFTLPKNRQYVSSTPLFMELAAGIEATQPVLAFLATQSFTRQNKLWRALTGEPLGADVTIERRAQKFHALATAAEWNTLPKKTEHLFNLFAQTEPLFINYYGGAQTLRTIPIDRVLAMEQAELKRLFKKQVVYVGYLENQQTEQQDSYRTVYSNRHGVDISGVEISATVFTNLRHGNAIRPANHWVYLTLVLASFLFTVTCYQFAPRQNALAQVLLMGGYLMVCSYAFAQYHYWLPISLPLLVILAANGFLLQHYYRLNRQRLHHIRYALSQYLPQDAALALSRNINTLEKQHQLVYGVVLMTDIKGYTSLSERLPPAELHRLMNRYYQRLISVVERHHGFIGNIVGDSLMALWTGPKITRDMCDAAMRTALEIQADIQNDSELAQQLPTCIALHGGQFSLGNLGAQGHFEYSPVGDIINTVSRVEHFNRDLGTEFLCSATIAERLTSNVDNTDQEPPCPLRFLGTFNLRNKAAGVPLYTAALNDAKHAQSFAKAVELFKQHNFAAAETLFSQLLGCIEDGPCRYYIKACVQQMQTTLSKR